MSTPENPDQHPTKRATIPLWSGFVAAILVWDGLPWAISLLTPRLGWTPSRPDTWNFLGLFLVMPGNFGLFRGILAHSAETPGRLDFEVEKPYLLTQGLYRYSRNPMYVSELILMLGWVLFYGSAAVLIGLVLWWALFNFYVIPREERVMEARFGEAYREYKKKVPRWFGKTRA